MKWQDVLNRSTATLAMLVLMLGLLLAMRVLLPEDKEAAVASEESEMTAAVSVQGTTVDFFRDFRSQREQARTDELAMLDEIISRENAPEESVREADARRVEITRAMEQERMMEKLLIVKGFEDAAVFVAEDIVTIVIRQAELSDQENARIMELALRHTDRPAEKIKIIPYTQQ